ncbi:MAG: hypothetical protein JWL84_1932 [Rhodospirillales bacterium]|jgi:hypothetical protein|nr:hypothetical protein [Rhodospirillales bacterium]
MFLNKALGRGKTADLKPGENYCRNHGPALIETATVLELRNDQAGIPHVRFSVRFQHDAKETVETALRLLSVPAFQSCYRRMA